MNDAVIHELTEQEVITLQQVEVARDKLEAFEAEFIRPEWLGTSHRWVLGAYWHLTKFWGILGHIWSFLGLRQLVKDGAQREAEIREAKPIFGTLLGFLGWCKGKGMLAHGITHI